MTASNDSSLRSSPLGVLLAIFFFVFCIAVEVYAPRALGAVLLLVALDGLRSTRMAVRALVLIYIIRALNPGFAGEAVDLMLPGLVAALICCGRIYFDWLMSGARTSSISKSMTLLLSVFALTSIISSQFVTVSVFKLLLFGSVAMALLLGASNLSVHRDWMLSRIVDIYVAVLLLSVPLMFLPIGYFRDGQGFQGILNHPQEYGIFMAPFAALLLARSVADPERRLERAGLFLVVACTLVMTRSRNGVLAMILGVLVAYSVERLGRLSPAAVLRFSLGAVLLTAAILGLLVSDVGGVTGAIQSFLLKEGGESISESFETSRGFLMLEALENFLANPISGIGFGVTISEFRPSMPVYEPLTGLPISFPTEKGYIPIAVLEEVGIVGFWAFVAFLLRYFGELKRVGSVPLFAMALGVFLTNLGEMTFFSMNGYGLMSWCLLGISIAYPHANHRIVPSIPR